MAKEQLNKKYNGESTAVKCQRKKKWQNTRH